MIKYTFVMDDDERYVFEIEFDRPARKDTDSTWTALDFHQCDNCPLDPGEHPHCPAAIDVENIVARFKDIISHKKANVIVKTPQRSYFKYCDVQNGLSSLLGLVMATSACPILSQMRGLAHYHLPFASEEETLFRVVGAHLLKQYYAMRKGDEPDLHLKDLVRLYEELQVLNRSFAKRIRAASEMDANVNAIVILFTISELVSFSLEDKLELLKPLFFPF